MSHCHHPPGKGKTRSVAGTWWDVLEPPGRSEPEPAAPSPKPPLVAARPGSARVRGYNHRRPDELLVNCLKVEVC